MNKKEYSRPSIRVSAYESSLVIMESPINASIKNTSDPTVRSKGESDWDDVDDGFGW